MTNTEQIPCAECGEPIEVHFHNGVIPQPNYLLVADWIFHTECWNKKVDENPP